MIPKIPPYGPFADRRARSSLGQTEVATPVHVVDRCPTPWPAIFSAASLGLTAGYLLGAVSGNDFDLTMRSRARPK